MTDLTIKPEVLRQKAKMGIDELPKEPEKKRELPFFYGRKCLSKTCKVTDKHGGQQVIEEFKFRGLPMVTLFCTGCVELDKQKRPLVYSISLTAL